MFVVLHYQDGSSDKIWAINKVANAITPYPFGLVDTEPKLQSKKLATKRGHL